MERNSQSRHPASTQGDRPSRDQQAFSRRIDCGSAPARPDTSRDAAPGARGNGAHRAPGEGA